MKKVSRIASLPLLLLVFSTTAWGQSNASVQSLLDAIKANPKDATAHFNLGVAYFNDQKYDSAIPEFQKCLEINSGDKQAREMLESSQGISAYFQKNYSSAVDHLQNALKVNPQNPNANLLLADSYVQLKQYPNAEKALKDYSLTSPQGKEKASEVLSKIYMDQKRYQEAVIELKNIVDANPKNFEANENLGVAYFQMKDYKDAARYWENAARLRKDAQTYKFLGFSYYNLGDFNNAIDNYKRSIAIEKTKDPKDQNVDSLGETYYNLAVAYNDYASYDKAADAFGEAFKINPKDSNAAVGRAQAIEAATNSHMEKASNYLLNNQYSAAIAEWKMVPDNKQAQDFITDAQGKLDVEVKKHENAGKVFLKKGNTLQALAEWNLALQMDPANQEILHLIKNVDVKRKDRVKALLAEGDGYYKDRDFSEALVSYSKAHDLDPKSSTIKSRIKKLKSLQNNEIDSVYKKAMSYGAKGDLKSAQKYLLLAKQLDPSNSKINNSLFGIQKSMTVKIKDLDAEGVSLYEGGDKEKARGKFQEVLTLKPNDDTANDYIKKLTGQEAHEKVDAEQVKALYYDGVNLYINGKIHEAIEKWQECKKLDPNNINAQKNIEKAMVKLQSIEKLSRN